MKVLALSTSPRTDGNSRVLADAVLEGAAAAGHETALVHVADHVQGLLRDCRRCRRPDGSCSIDDGYADLLLGPVLAADAIVYATPLYWYGVSGILKTFLDRLFCFIAASYPDSERVVDGLMGKRAAAVISAEETYPGAALGVIHHFQELARYLHHDFVGVVIGNGNRRGEVRRDPNDPLGAARDLGGRLFARAVTDYRIDTVRPTAVWGDGPPAPAL